MTVFTDFEPRVADAGHGYDDFGAHADSVVTAAGLARVLYDVWFRVSSEGSEHIPDGAAILASNHGGTLPFDAAMIWVDVLRHTNPPRLVRPVADWFVSRLPFLGTAFARCGVVGGTRRNVERLLERRELVLIFPEGTPGIGKTFAERYTLQHFRVGHVEMALRQRAPVVPVAVIGAEEQLPLITKLPFHPFGAPFLPVPATLIPMPVRYHIYYGEPIWFDAEYGAESADNPRVLDEAAARVRMAVAALIERGLRERRGIFR